MRDLTSKTERLGVMRDVFAPSNRNARVAISGAVQSSVLLCLLEAIAFDVAARFSGELAPDDAATDSTIAELANLLCGNLRSLRDALGARVEVARAERVATRVSIPPSSCIALVPFPTHRGQVLVGFVGEQLFQTR